MTMKCSTLLAMSLVCVSQVAGADFVPIRGSASSDYVTDFSKTVPIQCDYDSNGDGQPDGGLVLTIPGTHQGKFSHLGKTTGESTVMYNTCNGTYMMDIDFVSANGDTIHLTGDGYDVLPAGPDGGIVSFANLHVDGGTGRFESALGNVTLSGLRYDDLITGRSVDTFDLAGTISTVGIGRAAFPVPEPTSQALLGLGGALLSCFRKRRRR
jgi:hypothetical protein